MAKKIRQKKKRDSQKPKTTAQRKEQESTRNRMALLRWLAIGFLGVVYVLSTFVFISYSFTGLVCLCVMSVLLFYNVADWLQKKYPKQVKVVRRIFTVCLCVGLLLVAVTEVFILRGSLGDPDKSCDYVVVLGCHVRPNGPSLTLLDRINAAYDYLTEHPDVIAVVSGGQGFDEPMSEAQCIYEHLVERGIDPDRVWIEDKATSTWENLNFSLDMIRERTGTRPDTLGIISSEYHLFRAGLQAKDCGVVPVRIPAVTSVISQRVNHFMREVAGVWYYLILGGNYE